MNNEEVREVLQEQIDKYGQEYDDRGIEALKTAIKMLEQQPCEDCISRERAVYVASGYCAPQNIADELRKLPSVTPQPFINKPCISEGVCHEDKISVLDKIKAEIKALSNANPSYWHSGDMVEREDVLEIIDKYKAESEDNE